MNEMPGGQMRNRLGAESAERVVDHDGVRAAGELGVVGGILGCDQICVARIGKVDGSGFHGLPLDRAVLLSHGDDQQRAAAF